MILHRLRALDISWRSVEGTGDRTVAAKDTVTVHATGIVKETGKKFWSTKDAVKPKRT
jgi:hypothetical protein